MNKNSKAKEKQIKENNERLLKERGNTGGGNPNCDNEGITDGDSTNTSGTVGVDYTVQGFTAVGSNCKDSTDQIRIVVDGPSSPPAFVTSTPQGSGVTFQPDEAGTWIIQASAVGQFGSRTITVAGADAGADFSLTQLTAGQLDGSASIANAATGAITSYSWDEPFTLDATNVAEPTFTAPAHTGGGPDKYTFTLTVTYADLSQSVDTVEVTVTKN